MLAKKRQTDSRSLVRFLRGDLDWIIMMALEKDRARRYSTASEFAADVERFMKQQPVTAGPPSVLYQGKKFLQRHRAAALVFSLVAFTSVFLSVIAWQYSKSLQYFEMGKQR